MIGAPGGRSSLHGKHCCRTQTPLRLPSYASAGASVRGAAGDMLGGPVRHRLSNARQIRHTFRSAIELSPGKEKSESSISSDGSSI